MIGEQAKTRVLVFGSRGWLGSKIAEKFSREKWAFVIQSENYKTASSSRISDYGDVAREFKQHRPDVVINAIGKKSGGNSSNIDGCLDEKAATMFANITVPGLLARACGDFGGRLVHISTGCLWQDSPEITHYEDDDPDPNSFYSETKIQGEILVRQYADSLILRPRMPFDSVPHPGNLLTKLLSFKTGVLADVMYPMQE